MVYQGTTKDTNDTEIFVGGIPGRRIQGMIVAPAGVDSFAANPQFDPPLLDNIIPNAIEPKDVQTYTVTAVAKERGVESVAAKSFRWTLVVWNGTCIFHSDTAQPSTVTAYGKGGVTPPTFKITGSITSDGYLKIFVNCDHTTVVDWKVGVNCDVCN